MPLRDAFEQVAAQAAELRARLARTIVKAMRNILEIMVLSLRSSILARNFLPGPKNGCHCQLNPLFKSM
jgi:hypothetical protein